MKINEVEAAVGVPAKIIKQVTPAQAEASVRNAAHYVEHGRLHAAEAKKDLTFCR